MLGSQHAASSPSVPSANTPALHVTPLSKLTDLNSFAPNWTFDVITMLLGFVGLMAIAVSAWLPAERLVFTLTPTTRPVAAEAG